ncbi:hypothetical protein EZS27_016336 [termite gut metagenome]|uniref:Uncharacterized protein n=1 Tax=termite gut metagenome TaxID=433724 RepID=A0A5J4RNI6_9ZZZZ
MKLSSKRFLWLLPLFTLVCICVLNLIEATIDGISYLKPFKFLSWYPETNIVYDTYAGRYITFLILIGLYFYLYVWIVSKYVNHFWNITILSLIPQIGLYYFFFFTTNDVSLFFASVLFYIAVYQHFKSRGEIVADPLSYKVTGKWISSKRFLLLLPLFIIVWDIFVVVSVCRMIEMSVSNIVGLQVFYFRKHAVMDTIREAIMLGTYLYAYLCFVSIFVKRFWRVTILFLMPVVVFTLIYLPIHDITTHQYVPFYAIGNFIAVFVPFYILVYQHFKRRGEIGKLKKENSLLPTLLPQS